MEPFINGYLETYEDGLKNTYGKDTLEVERINMAREEDDYTPIFFMGVGSSDSEDEDDVRFRQELIRQQLIGKIMDSNADHSPEPHRDLSIEALEQTFHNETGLVTNNIPNNSTRGVHRPIQEIRQELRNDIRHEMINMVNRSWEEDVLINDAFGEKFSLNNLLTFQATSSPPTVENENSAPNSDNQFESINQREPPDQGGNMSNFHYP